MALQHSCKSGAHTLQSTIMLLHHHIRRFPSARRSPRCLKIFQCRLMAPSLAARRLRQLEGKVATLSVINDALQKENDTLREVRASDCVAACCSNAVHRLLQPPRSWALCLCR